MIDISDPFVDLSNRSVDLFLIFLVRKLNMKTMHFR